MSIKQGVEVLYPLLICKKFVIFPDEVNTIIAEKDFSIASIRESGNNYDNYIVIATLKDNNNDGKNFENGVDTYEVGTLCRISSTSGVSSVKIKLTGLDRVKIHNYSYNPDLNCYIGSFELYPDVLKGDKKETLLIQNLFTKVESLNPSVLDLINKNVLLKKFESGLDALKISYLLCIKLPFNTTQKMELLEAEDVNARLEKILVNLDALNEDLKLENEIQEEVRKSAEKNQREYLLREKMRVIKEELDEGDELTDSDLVEKKLKSGNYPEYVQNKIRDELKKYNMMPQASLEASLIKNYIDILFSIPWSEKTEDNDDLENVKSILDEDHYGLKKVKERIIEYLAVKKKTGNLKAPILCFYGPPGVGKTSLAISIARALGRKFVKSSLGGVTDESEIRGHRRTYVGSIPGRVINGLRKAKSSNPVFLLDEIDKIGSSYKGDPANALLEVLDPEQNTAFYDNYIEEPYDLSNVLFICTANYLENVPEPLRDRLELIEVNSYTSIEKLHIAKEHLIKKEMDANGLSEKDIEFEDEAINYIIDRYTREAGVRELQRKIGSICRKVVLKLVSKKTKAKQKIDVKKVKEYLGLEIFDPSTKEKDKQVGVVTGLAYTEYGGDILPIEVTNFAGKGQLILTGKLGDVMKESCSIAYDYIRANAKKYEINSEVFEKNDLHIHFPEGAIPKDGPSAGCAITVAIISCLKNIPVSGDIAMTGEVTLRGKAIPIGGLREKSLAALRSGIKTIIIPEENKKNVKDLPEEVRDNLNIVYMESVDKAINICLH